MLALLAVIASLAVAPQEVTIPASDGTQLACALVQPETAAPAGGYPAVILFHGLGGSHADMEPLATGTLAPAGYASLMCDARGTGASSGQFDLDGPKTVQDVRDEFAWLAARPEVSDTAIGAFGLSLGGGAVWNATAAGVPFKAIVPTITWTSLVTALAPQGLPKSGLVTLLSFAVPSSRWESDLLGAAQSLEAGTLSSAATAIAAARSPKPATISTPTLLVQGRRDFLFDEAQAKTAFRSLAGPKALYIGDLGHPPAANPPAELSTLYAIVLQWLNRYVKGSGTAPAAVTLAHDTWDGTVSTFSELPATHTLSVTMPGAKSVRSARFPGALHETFGGGTVTVRYANASSWDRLIAVVSVNGRTVTLGGTRITAPSGVATIKLMDESTLIPAGAKVTLQLGATSAPNEIAYSAGVPKGASIVLGRATLALSFLKRAVSH